MNILEIFKKSAVCSGMKRKRGCRTKRLLPEMSFRACREIPEGQSCCQGDSGTRHGCCYPKQVLDNTSSTSVGMTGLVWLPLRGGFKKTVSIRSDSPCGCQAVTAGVHNQIIPLKMRRTLQMEPARGSATE